MIQAALSPTIPKAPDTHETRWLSAVEVTKTFTLHHQGNRQLNVLNNVALTVNKGDCVALQGASGSGKSTFMRSLYANYRVNSGAIWINHNNGQNNTWVDLTQCDPHELIEIRARTIGYVSQFLRVIPRVPALQVAAEPLMELGIESDIAQEKVRSLFTRLNLPERLWSLSPTTFSGGEKQRVNIARAFAVDRPILLLDEPTAALDQKNREAVIELIEEKKAEGCGLVGIFHDHDVKSRVCNQTLTFGSHY